MRHLVWILLVPALAAGGCAARGFRPYPAEKTHSIGCQDSGIAMKLDRGDWMVSKRSTVFKVIEMQGDKPPKRIGYLVRRSYRQMRGGPAYEISLITTLNRGEEIGRIDQMGRAVRYEPQRNGTFEEVDVGLMDLDQTVAAIFDTKAQVVLEQTNERELAFETLDRNGSGVLEADEIRAHGDRFVEADVNQDGKLDFAEFDAIDVL